MCKTIKYTIFETKWGYFGLAGIGNAVSRTHLPTRNKKMLKKNLLKNLRTAEYQADFLKTIQKMITAYFNGNCVNFSPRIKLLLTNKTPFAVSILNGCRSVSFSQTTTYSQLAKKTGHPKAARAAGTVLSKNPIPLIIPCHRVIRKDGKIGGFSAPGGKKIKKRLLQHEQKTLFRSKF